jgi:hypothetical protein
MPNSTALNRISNIVLARVGNILSITKKILVEEKIYTLSEKEWKIHICQFRKFKSCRSW